MRKQAGITIVSNRLPVRLLQGADGAPALLPSDGGLVSALRPVLRRRGGSWVGYSGSAGASGLNELQAMGDFGRREGYRLVPVPMSEHEHRSYYEDACNRVLWPLLHGFVSHTSQGEDDARVYRDINARFAETVARRRPDVVWVHDYHLLSIGAELRRRLPHARLGFFLHIPFPTPDVMVRLGWGTELLPSLAAFNLIGFQTVRDRENFQAWVKLVGTDSGWWHLDHRSQVFGISVDWARYHKAADEPSVRRRAAAIRAEHGSRRILLGVDRLDYTKGIPERLRAYIHMLETTPELRGQVVFVQLAIPSRTNIAEYERIREETEELVSSANARFGTPDWVPVHYVYGSWDHEELLAWYGAADVALVTPLNDGMNLVAKEFCAANRGSGVLVLSRAAGAADEIGEPALLVDPTDPEDIAAAVRRALDMSPEERDSRMRVAQRHLKRHDVHRWAASFLDALEGRREPVSA